jgi:MerR family transcriptional regulator, copper efflux regulator
VAFALRLRSDDDLRGAVEGWLEATAQRPAHVPAPDWLRWEQEKHSKLLAVAAAQRPTTLMETR